MYHRSRKTTNGFRLLGVCHDWKAHLVQNLANQSFMSTSANIKKKITGTRKQEQKLAFWGKNPGNFNLRGIVL
jgi:hypothetical protein